MPKTVLGVGHRDTDTSAEAAKKFERKALSLKVLVRASLGRGPKTVDEIAADIDRPGVSVRPRVSELKEAGKVRDTGKRRDGAFGNSQIVWELVPEAQS